MQEICGEQGIQIKTAMIADINGISMGQRDAMIENGVEFLYTNIHTHHGMYPLYQNQKPYFWENEEVSSEEYERKLNEVYDTEKEIKIFQDAQYDSEKGRYVGNGLCDYQEIIEAIEEISVSN